MFSSFRYGCYLIFTFAMMLCSVSAQAATVSRSTIMPSDNPTPILVVGTKYTEASLSYADIESLPFFDTSMIKHFDGPEGRFSGVWLNDLLKKYGLYNAERLRLVAHDGYEVFLSKQQREQKRYFLATRLNGHFLSINELGPLMVIVPDDGGEEVRGDVSHSHWIWALKQLKEQ
ncbi:hypothetical protein [Marinomonas mediterranea]|uniref:Oxidoreductase molybdopterin-binding domain-containing protein n=1 Tax=Marinomonas mediterranea (strain ATCC 700492 / JCM 21426 / NBRC 103028 / MMB-1) TaxID=717774 RepID=F2K3U9_MARM1|nr:hypothetical protein [Marinomonas mediterranea]ADZ90198.1 hypothetical protein Marme_0923 [Marinomonas mediterranea MMB-1]WCN08259.1 hypothetical protein GV055_04660 [Marinomonas mediterranea]WCN12325.1 hypothetical protein GV054_04560 [Marinomonas mediterranea]WCN16397.1 hypothetical protein GV053_04665 [Marinomonas mediterranea MMB-1]